MPDDRHLSDRYLDHSQVALCEWSGVEVFRSRAGPGIFPEHEHPEVQLSVRIVRPESGRSLASPGSLSIVESGSPHAGTLDHRAEFLMLYLHPERLDREAFAISGQSSVELRDAERSDDSWMTAALATMHGELHRGASNGVVAEALSMAVLTQLLANHSTLRLPGWTRVRPLAAHDVREACGLLEEALVAGTSIAAIATHLGMGASRFAKAFRSAVGMPPYAYLIRHRVLRTAREIATGDKPLAQVALDGGFSSQSHMTAQFRRVLGTTPASYRRKRE